MAPSWGVGHTGVGRLAGRASTNETSPQARTGQRSKRLNWLRAHEPPLVQEHRDILPLPPSSPATPEPRNRQGTKAFLEGGVRKERLEEVGVQPGEGEPAGRWQGRRAHPRGARGGDVGRQVWGAPPCAWGLQSRKENYSKSAKGRGWQCLGTEAGRPHYLMFGTPGCSDR